MILNNGGAVSEENPMPTKSGATGAAPITPNDTTDIATTKGVYVGGSGNLTAIMSNGDTVTFIGMSAGMIHPLEVTRILATGTTATNLVAVY
jgi:hypothetical protein